MVDHFHKYIYQKRGFYYFSRRVPKELYQHHAKQRIVLALNTRSKSIALKYAQIISQRLDNRWLLIRLDAMGLSDAVANDVEVMNAPLFFKRGVAIRDNATLSGSLCFPCIYNLPNTLQSVYKAR